MAWGKSSIPKPPPPPKSALSKLLPLFILFIVLGGLAFVGYHVYLIVCNVQIATNEKMEKKNVVFTKDGMKVGVKELRNENYVDTTQSFLVKAWNLSTWPEYKSRLWNKDAQINKVESRKPFSRHSSTT
ncbi:uncharacterized protein RSE6_10856 [Rhynchosporium secalis]|uniref:Uncharacterized protein n=1 Tax=Rhynchosporium secalis TaxID=38038 RepID=A0A1E1MLI6_RHYSE|nr:uncharacterized protein RSE6_10856 [Rhynchosporium secalis]